MTLPLLLLGISIISFMLLNFAPGDAAEITLVRQNGGVSPSREEVAELRHPSAPPESNITVQAEPGPLRCLYPVAVHVRNHHRRLPACLAVGHAKTLQEDEGELLGFGVFGEGESSIRLHGCIAFGRGKAQIYFSGTSRA